MVVLDTNLIFSALLSQNSRIRDALLMTNQIYYAPNFVIAELFAKRNKLAKYTKLNPQQLELLVFNLAERIRFVSMDFIDQEAKNKAYELCREIDEKDTPFVALSLALNAPLWTGDKTLKAGLATRGFTNFYNPDNYK